MMSHLLWGQPVGVRPDLESGGAVVGRRWRHVFGLIGSPFGSQGGTRAPAGPPPSSTTAAKPGENAHKKDAEMSVTKDLETMAAFFTSTQACELLFRLDDVGTPENKPTKDSQAGTGPKDAKWLREELQNAFAEDNVRSFWIYYSGHGRDEDGAWAIGQHEYITADEVLGIWAGSPAAQSRHAVLAIISDSCYSGHWPVTAQKLELDCVAVQAATAAELKTFYTQGPTVGGVFTYWVYSNGAHLFRSVFSPLGLLTAATAGPAIALCALASRLRRLLTPQSTEVSNQKSRSDAGVEIKRGELFPVFYKGRLFTDVLADIDACHDRSRIDGTVQPDKATNGGRFLFVDSIEWLMFRPLIVN